MKYTETRTLNVYDLRNCCIRNNWYTRGTCKEYEALFDKLNDDTGCPVNMTTEKLVEIAEDIWEHSKITDYTLETVLFELARTCTTYFEIV